MENELKEIIADSLASSLSYSDYRTLVDDLAETGSTTGPEQKASLVNYTKLNSRRLKRWDKTFKLTESALAQIKKWDRGVIWLVITESWCGDAAPTMPVMNRIAEQTEKVDLRVVLRDEHPELMSHFLTNNAMSIPKLIMIDKETLEVLGDWGPRPSLATQKVLAYKKLHGTLTSEFKEDLQLWYNKDKGTNTLEDLLSLLTLEDVGNSALL
ncbi:MAG: thioredoxin family protein [Flavobacteriaceae bacterium]